MKMTGNTILITGGTSGIGLELARQLLALDNVVIVTGRDGDRLKAAVADNPGLHAVQSDASDPAAIVALHDDVTRAHPELNILVNNAGFMKQVYIPTAGVDLIRLGDEVETNLNGPIRMTAQFLPHLVQQKSAAIVNVSSGLAFVPFPVSPIYCATKAAIHSLSISLRVQLQHTCVKVFELAPPLTSTPLVHSFGDDVPSIPLLPVDELARLTIQGLSRDRPEIRPGLSGMVKLISRLAPNWLLHRMLASSVDRLRAAST